jgi:serine/threonine protein kinase
LDNGSVPDAEDLPKVWADRLNEVTKVIPPASVSDGKPISDRYIIRRELGGGGQGIVYEADDLELGRRVAIKKVRPEYQDDPSAMGALIEEARNTGRLDHSGVIPIFDLNKDDRGKPLFAMRLIRGDRLSDVIERIGYGVPYPLAWDCRTYVGQLRHSCAGKES